MNIKEYKQNFRKTGFYKYYKEKLNELIEGYENPKEYNLDKLTNESIDNLLFDLIEDNCFNNTVDSYLREELERYANKELVNEEERE